MVAGEVKHCLAGRKRDGNNKHLRLLGYLVSMDTALVAKCTNMGEYS